MKKLITKVLRSVYRNYPYYSEMFIESNSTGINIDADMISREIKEEVWDNYFGKTAITGKCFICKNRINRHDLFECVYYISPRLGGLTLANNLKPVCKNCDLQLNHRCLLEIENTLNPDTMPTYGFDLTEPDISMMVESEMSMDVLPQFNNFFNNFQDQTMSMDFCI